MESLKFISVLCPVSNEERYITECIDSMLNQDYPRDKMEVLFIDGMSSDMTRSIIAEYSNKHPFIKLLDNHEKIVPHALNIGIRASKGEVIIRVDAHSIYPANYFSVLVDKLFKFDAENVGGVVITKPADDSIVSRSIAIALSHPFGVGNSFFRIGSKKSREVDTVPFGCFRRSIFDRIGYFDEDLVRNQDDEFNARIIKNGGKIFLISGLEIPYYARNKMSKVSKMFYQYGLFKPLVNKKLGKPATLRQFAPLLFVVLVLFGSFFSFFIDIFFGLTLSLLAIYLLFSILFSIHIAISRFDYKYLFILPIVFAIIHVSYGWGYICGIHKFLIMGKKSVYKEVNR